MFVQWLTAEQIITVRRGATEQRITAETVIVCSVGKYRIKT